MKFLITVLMCLTFIEAFSQNNIYIGTKSYPSTDTWLFLKKGHYDYMGFDASLEVTFAKSSNGGLLMLSTGGVFSETQSIGGKILIYLSNGDVLEINKRLYKDFADKKATSIYSITLNQINKLKTYDIAQIRYSLIDGYGGKSGTTAENRYNNGHYPGIVHKEGAFQTAREISFYFSPN